MKSPPLFSVRLILIAVLFIVAGYTAIFAVAVIASLLAIGVYATAIAKAIEFGYDEGKKEARREYSEDMGALVRFNNSDEVRRMMQAGE